MLLVAAVLRMAFEIERCYSICLNPLVDVDSNRDVTHQYNFNTCTDCFCRPARERDIIDAPICPTLAPEPSQFLLVICCLPPESAVEDMDGRLGMHSYHPNDDTEPTNGVL